MFLLVGLGNIGTEYVNTRHNFGFKVIERIHDTYVFAKQQQKFSGIVAAGEILQEKVIILKPTTYMNNSGEAVAKVKKFYQIPPEHIVVFHDEVDLELGRVKLKVGGDAAGHNGVKSINQSIGKNYTRIRLGVRPLANFSEDSHYNNFKTPEFVLGRFSKQEASVVTEVTERVCQLLPLLLLDDKQEFANRINNPQQNGTKNN